MVVINLQEVVVAVTKNQNTLGRLGSAAMLLPAISSQAATIDDNTIVDVQSSFYRESDQRMNVDVYEAQIDMPVSDQNKLSLGFIVDVISGASPMFNMKQQDGSIRQIISGASIKEQRDVVNVALQQLIDNNTALNFSVGVSDENDYLSRYGKIALSRDMNQKMTTVFGSLSYASDKIQVKSIALDERKRTTQFSLGATQIIDARSLVSINMGYAENNGYQSDPYKYVYSTISGIASDSRPRGRHQYSALAQYVRNFDQFNHAALHLDYRYYRDNWQVDSHMAQVTWHQPLAQDWEIVPQIRYYSQSAAYFYQHYFDTTLDNYHSSDYRLADFGALSAGIYLRKNLYAQSIHSDIKLKIGMDYYDRRARYALKGDTSVTFADYSSIMLSAKLQMLF